MPVQRAICRRITRRGSAAAAVAAVVAIAVGGCGSSTGTTSAKAPNEPQVRLVQAGKLTMCSNLPYEPFEFTKDGEIVGFDIDIMDRVAQRLGVERQTVDMDFAPIRSGAALNSEKCDVAVAGITITERISSTPWRVKIVSGGLRRSRVGVR